MIRGRAVHGYLLEEYDSSIQKLSLISGAIKLAAVDAVKPLPTPNRSAYIYEISDERDVKALEIYGYEFLDHFVGSSGSVYFEIPDGRLIDVIRDPIFKAYSDLLRKEAQRATANCPPLHSAFSVGFRAGLRWPTNPVSPLPKKDFLPSYATALFKGLAKCPWSVKALINYIINKEHAVIKLTEEGLKEAASSSLGILTDTIRYGCSVITQISDYMWSSLPHSIPGNDAFKYLRKGIESVFGYIDLSMIKPISDALYGYWTDLKCEAEKYAEQSVMGILLSFLYPIEIGKRFALSVPAAGGVAVESVPTVAYKSDLITKMSWPETASSAAYDAIIKVLFQTSDIVSDIIDEIMQNFMRVFCWRYGSMYSYPCSLLNTPFYDIFSDLSISSMFEFAFGSRCNRAVITELNMYCREGQNCSRERAYEIFREMKSEVELDPLEHDFLELKRKLDICTEKYTEMFEKILLGIPINEQYVKRMTEMFYSKLMKRSEATASSLAGKKIEVVPVLVEAKQF